jgi:hypothetical protein
VQTTLVILPCSTRKHMVMFLSFRRARQHHLIICRVSQYPKHGKLYFLCRVSQFQGHRIPINLCRASLVQVHDKEQTLSCVLPPRTTFPRCIVPPPHLLCRF